MSRKSVSAGGNGSSADGTAGERSRIADLINDHAQALSPEPVKRRMPSEERFEQIVDVAVRIIGKKGYYGMSLQDVASAIGISQTAVIHRVKSKQGLLVAVIERYYDRADAVNAYSLLPFLRFRPSSPC